MFRMLIAGILIVTVVFYAGTAIAPEFTYENLEIQDGGSASSLFHQSIENGKFSEENLRENLLKYCERDTLAMVVIYQFLVEII